MGKANIEALRHRIKRLHELGPNHEFFKLGDMDCEALLLAYDAVVKERDEMIFKSSMRDQADVAYLKRHDALAAQLSGLKREAIKLKQQMVNAMKYYESCGEESDPEYQLFRSHEKACAAFDAFMAQQETK